MKISLALGPRQPLSRQTAWGCFTTNLAMPGFGSLIGGRVSGYFQILLSWASMALTGVFGVQFIRWYLHNWNDIQTMLQRDPDIFLANLWAHVRLALLGIALFAAAWIWALISSLGILSRARGSEALPRPGVPPKL